MQYIYEPHVSINQELPFIFHQDVYCGDDGVPNWHENLELLYITSGHGEVLCGSQVYTVGEGDIVVANTYDAHEVRAAGEMVLYCLIIDRKFGKSNGIDTNELRFAHYIRCRELEEKFLKVREEYTNRQPFFNAGVKCAVLELLVYLCRNYSTPKEADDKARGSSYECVRFAIEYIKTNYDKKLTVDIIAGKAGLSKYYFLREFKNVTGHTVIAYVNIVRCEYAKEMLRKGKYSVKDVAHLCGFDNDSYFSNVFKKYTGELPSEYVRGM